MNGKSNDREKGGIASGLTVQELLSHPEPEKLFSSVPFEKGLSLLESLVSQVESGTLPLNEALLCYERGSALLESLRCTLQGAERKLEILQASRGKTREDNSPTGGGDLLVEQTSLTFEATATTQKIKV